MPRRRAGLFQRAVESLMIWVYAGRFGAVEEFTHRGVLVVVAPHLYPEWADGQVIGSVIFVRSREVFFADPAFRCHELEHVRQVERDGLFRFFVKYGWEYLLGRFRGLSHFDAGRAVSYEVDADNVGFDC